MCMYACIWGRSPMPHLMPPLCIKCVGSAHCRRALRHAPSIRPSKVLKENGSSTSGATAEDNDVNLDEAISKCFIGNNDNKMHA